MTKAVVYTNGNQECERITSLLKNLQIEILEYQLNNHFTQRAFESEFGKEATYPQVALGYTHIGNMKETLQFMKDRGMFND
ncbi:glutaredoxin [Synechococcus phage S-B43]|nr:glutaredoxin [Synechococcus phage S-B05]QDH50623.1 glutaredoxin [Synechococcus phage S-B43]